MDSMQPWVVPAVVVALVLLVLVVRSRDGSGVSLATPPGQGASVPDLVHSGRKIEAIKLYRAEHGVGLKEAKEAVEAIARETRPPAI